MPLAPGQSAVIDQREDLGAGVKRLADAIGQAARDQLLFEIRRLRIEAHQHRDVVQCRARLVLRHDPVDDVTRSRASG